MACPCCGCDNINVGKYCSNKCVHEISVVLYYIGDFFGNPTPQAIGASFQKEGWSVESSPFDNAPGGYEWRFRKEIEDCSQRELIKQDNLFFGVLVSGQPNTIAGVCFTGATLVELCANPNVYGMWSPGKLVAPSFSNSPWCDGCFCCENKCQKTPCNPLP